MNGKYKLTSCMDGITYLNGEDAYNTSCHVIELNKLQAELKKTKEASSVFIWCQNGCGFANAVIDCECMGCKYGKKIAERREEIRLLRKELLKRCSFKEFEEVEKEIKEIMGGEVNLKRKINNGRNITININGVKYHNFSQEHLSYMQIANLAKTNHSNNPSITYKSASDSGILSHDEELKLVDGIIINCHITGNS